MNKQLNPNCPKCKGTGNIRFYFDQDNTRTVKCPKCFPDEKDRYEELKRQFHASYDFEW